MAGQVWQTNSLGGFMWSPNLSRKLRTALQPMIRFRQFCDAREAFGKGKGDAFNWNVYSDVAVQGGTLNGYYAGNEFHDYPGEPDRE